MPEKKKGVLPRLRFPEFRDAGEWAEIELGSIGNVSMCKRVMKHETSEKGDIPFYKIGTFGKKADAFINKELYESYKSKYPYPKKGDILISASGTIGRLVVYDGMPAYFQDSNIVWMDNDESVVINSFLFYCYGNINWKTDDNTISRLYNENIRKFKIHKPLRKEQQKIADCLSSLDEVIDLEAQKLEALKAHKKGLMQQLFPCEGETTPRLRFPEFRDAGEWEVKRLGDVVKVTGGGTPSTKIKEFWDGSIPWVSSSDIAEDSVHGINVRKFITEEAIKNSATRIVPANSILLVSRVSVGKLAVSRRPMCTSQDFTNLTPVKDDALFLAYCLKAIVHIFESFNQGMAIKGFTKEDVENLQIALPNFASGEQQKIADCLSSLDEVIDLEAQKLEALKAHKKGLMQQLFPQEVD